MTERQALASIFAIRQVVHLCIVIAAVAIGIGMLFPIGLVAVLMFVVEVARGIYRGLKEAGGVTFGTMKTLFTATVDMWRELDDFIDDAVRKIRRGEATKVTR